MKKFNKVYVLAPYSFTTGGVELCHQLVDYLRDNRYDAYIVYVVNGNTISNKQDITLSYNKYNIRTTNYIEDNDSNMLICPEIYFDFMYRYTKIKLGFWWMSVDNHYGYCNIMDALKFHKGFIRNIKILKRYFFNNLYRDKNSIKDILKNNDRILHLYQSHYAQFHLYKLGVSQVLPLSDYINTEFIGDTIYTKENIVLYNPLKGLNFTRKIINNLPNVKFIALKGMNREDLKKEMQKAKLYVDFGNFLGKDRLSRECAINGCCIITGKNGASYFYEDVPIPSEYKFNTQNKKIKKICEQINYVLDNYKQCTTQFNNYRKTILNEKEIFFKEINKIFFN